MYTDPRGEAYRQVIDLAVRNSERFVLGEKGRFPADGGWRRYNPILEALEPYLVETIKLPGSNREEIRQMMETYSSAFYTEGTYYIYACCEESGAVLKQAANRLSDWVYPDLPEDLCFLREGGGDYLYSVVHEDTYGMDITEEEAVVLMERITGLFLELEAHRDLDCLLEDAIKHQTDRLYVSGHRLTELPERIRELTELRDLEIFEQDLYQLPEGVFELSKLERLRIMTADLEGLPASIGKLKNLRELSISCGSSDRPAPGWRPKPKEEIGLDRIPPEIGELKQLEQLTIQYSSIQELPAELEKLKNLRSLDLGSSMIKHKPDFLFRMHKLESIHVAQQAYWSEETGDEME
ncbi:leucine-rich repeat domain-containing protein [Paenibacillus sambharensis]|uniref:Leucine-rich repeat domain-containing protein n=1 Tax=Paenibacillus sambharensis TaxID=1803190 RepID=A0A2W1L2H5_9BACL|nr:leucine-rich repeat domain-containing protein [Paenibacillus sambharensis]